MHLYVVLRNEPICSQDYYGLYNLDDAKQSLMNNGVVPAIPATPGGIFTPGTPAQYSDQQIFDEWVRLERNDMAWLDALPECPDKICIVHSCILWILCRDDAKIPDRPEWTDHWGGFGNGPTKTFPGHAGATWCMRSKKKDGHGQQCCYDSDGELLSDASDEYAPGTPDRSHWTRVVGANSHNNVDNQPFLLADRLDGGNFGQNNLEYHSVRPPSQGGGASLRASDCCLNYP